MCQQCGHQHSKWMGRCGSCGEWNSVVEEKASSSTESSLRLESGAAPTPLGAVDAKISERRITDLSEFDTVLGGGVVLGSTILIGGEPGIGKSTLLLQVAEQYAKNNHKVLYVTGEESLSQIALRSQRLGIREKSILAVSETNLSLILDHLEKLKPQILILDSVQTVYSPELDSQAGTVGQLRECAFRIIEVTKKQNMSSFLVGHVTKEGALAGPKVLEHMVDAVLYFEGSHSHAFRILRPMKNRFGSTGELAIFQMTGTGMIQVTNPSELFLSEKPQRTAGTAITAIMEGTRPILVEVQTMVSRTQLPMPRRTSIGIDSNRLSLLVAILEKRGGLRFFDQDIYVNVVGGLKLTEPAADLAVIAALTSSLSGEVAPTDSVYFGEVGLGGEVRKVPRVSERLREASRIGFKKAYLPRGAQFEMGKSSLKVIEVEHIEELTRRKRTES